MNNHNVDDVDESLEKAIRVITNNSAPRESCDALLATAASWPNKSIEHPKRPFVRLAILASLAASLLLVAGAYPFLAPVASVKEDPIRRTPAVAQINRDSLPALNTKRDGPGYYQPYLLPVEKQVEELHDLQQNIQHPSECRDVTLRPKHLSLTPANIAEEVKAGVALSELEAEPSSGPIPNEPSRQVSDLYLSLDFKKVDSPRPGPVTFSGIPITDETLLEPGLELLVEYHGQWWRGQVKELGPGKEVSIRYIGWEESWDEVVPRSRLQLYRQAETNEGCPSTPDNLRPWGPEQVLGPPNTSEAGDKTTAWASLTPDNADEWLILEYDQPVHAVAILIYETYNPGSLSKIHLWNEQNQEVLVWTGNPIPYPGQREIWSTTRKRVVVIPTQVDFATKKVRLDLASKAIQGWNEIDAVGLVDEAGVTHWATIAVASSSYAVPHHSSNNSSEIKETPKDESTTLADAVRAFNQNAANDPIGKDQPPLTEDSVIAAIRWSAMDQEKLQLSDETMRILDEITHTRRLPKGYTLENITRFEPNDMTKFDAWSVRLRVPGGTIQNGTTCIMIENRMIRSQTAGPHERQVIEKWRKQNEGKPIRFGMPDEGEQRQFQQYMEDRKKAAEQDRAEEK